MTSNFLKRAASVRSLLPFILSFAALILVLPSLQAQTLTSGDIAGTVQDTSGAVIPGADVKAVNTGTGAEHDVVTGTPGDFRISLLQPGTYKVTVTSPGFQTTQATVVVSVGQIASSNFKLAIAQNAQTVEVVGGDDTLLQTDTSEMATTITQEQMQNLPNPGGDLTYPVNISQGVVMNTQGGYGNSSVFGLPATSNNFTVNGAEDNDPFLNLNNSGPSNMLLGANDVDEINVVANAFGSQYGSLGGVQENILTRSGTNQFHGNATYYWTNSAMNANQWFNDYYGAPLPYSNANQGGAGIGGPIVKDKAFFFANYETLRFVTSEPRQVIIPSSAYENAVLAYLTSNGQAGQIPFYQTIFSTYNNAPGATRATAYNGTDYANVFEGTAKSNLTESLVTARVDYRINANDSMFAHFKYDLGEQPTYVDPLTPNFDASSRQPDYEGQLQETHIFSPNLINQFIFSTAWYGAVFTNTDPTADAALTPYTLGFVDGSFSTYGGELTTFPEGRNTTQYQFNDDVSWTKGKHTLKFGFTYKREDVTDDDPQMYSQFSDALDYGPASSLTPLTIKPGSLDYFANGRIAQATQAFPQRPSAPIAVYNLGFYAQDEWKFSPNFQITAGIRVEHNSNPVCQTNCLARFNSAYNNVTAGLATPYDSVIASGQHQTFNGLQAAAIDPRIGFTFSPDNHPNTVLRGGFGMFTDIFPAEVADYMLTNPPFSATFAAGGYAAPTVPGSVSSTLLSTNKAFQAGYATGGSYSTISAADPTFSQPNFVNVDPNIRYPAYEEYSLQVQQQVGKHTSFQIGYVGNHGYHEPWVNTGVNMYGFGGAPATPTLPAFAEVTEIKSAASSNYNGLIASIKNQSKYVTLQFNYTYSHALDEISNGGFLPFGYNSAGVANPTTIDPFNLALQNYGNSDYDLRHSLNGDYLVNLPYLGGPRVLTDKWTLGGTLFWHTGFPFSVTDGAVSQSLAPNYAGQVLARIVNPSVPHHCAINKANPTASCMSLSDFAAPTAFGGQNRNQFTGPGYFNTDFTLMKGLKVPKLESGLFQVGVQAYNILNHPNFLNPDTNLSDGPGFGLVTATASAPTSVFGTGLGGNSSARILQLKANFKF